MAFIIHGKNNRGSMETFKLNHVFSLSSSYDKPRTRARIANQRFLMTLLMVESDFLALIITGLASVVLRLWIEPDSLNTLVYIRLIPVIFVFFIIYMLAGLYPGSRIGPVEELRRLTIATSLAFLILATLTFWSKMGIQYSRLTYTSAWLLAILVVPAFRYIVRAIAIRVNAWGEPVAIIGAGEKTNKLVDILSKRHELGLKPVVVIEIPGSDNSRAADQWMKHMLPNLNRMFKQRHITTAIMVVEEAPEQLRSRLINENGLGLPHLILIPNVGFSASAPVLAYDFHHMLGLEVQRNLLSMPQKIFKRIIDLLLIFAGSIFLLPLFALIALAIVIESPGSVFFRHQRIGQNGIPFRVWKFRTMVPEADQLLKDLLASDPQARMEWESVHKLRHDPRNTRVGRLLRKTSLDELPQVINVLLGEMSLVGPRPIIEAEVSRYRDSFSLYKQVPPGITGLWQVSGRSNTTYEERVMLDHYYICNWSVWMDIYILIRTVRAVMETEGAC
jgi:Undecaprenyl-phosphate galactose phosphotransferase WbaP